MSDFRVWCLLIDHEKKAAFGDIFSVTVGSDVCIEDLTEKVKEQESDVFEHIDASMLTVWRCTDSEIDFGDMDLDESNDQLNKVFNPYEKKVKKLDSMQGVEQFRDQILLIEVPELNELHYPVAGGLSFVAFTVSTANKLHQAKKRKRDSDTSSASNESPIDRFQTNEQ